MISDLTRLSIRAMRSTGATIREVSAFHGCSVATVHRHCADIKPPRRPYPLRRCDPVEARSLKAQGWSYRQIARRQGVAHNRIFAAVNQGARP